MRKNLYRSGDAIFLKPGVLKGDQPKGPGRVVSALPETQGAVRYRVRFQYENFERNIALDEIDVAASSSSRPVEVEGSSSRDAGTSWINSNTIKIRK
ncbi:cold-shock protein [Rhizobium sp. GR12]|uniref:cold-shock protein n=1 Tax=Rhizobium sp. GR12 TaxID=3053925 RepID=UPI002FBECD49